MSDTARAKVHMGGASFSPRLPERPKYPSLAVWLQKVLVRYTRAPLLLALLSRVLYPHLVKLVEWMVGMGYSERTAFTAINVTLHVGMYVVVNGFFAVLEEYKLAENYRLAGKKSQVAKPGLVQRTLKEAFIGNVIAAPFVFYYVGFTLFKYFGMPDFSSPLPSLQDTCVAFAIAHFINDWGFYWAHRTFHSASIYKNIHKQHHSWINTRSISAEFAHHVEEVFANYLPSLGGMLFFGRHPVLLFAWLVFRLHETYEAHSNYYFGHTFLAKIGLTQSEAAAFHSAHHSLNVGCFGTFVTDWVGGTMDQWIANGGEEGYVRERLGKGMLE